VYLEREYLPEHNQRFARMAAKPENYHRRAPRAAELDGIFRLESERTVSEDWVVRYANRFFQLEPQSRHHAPAQSKVLVCEGRYGSIAVEYRGQVLRQQEIPAPTKPSVVVKRRASESVPSTAKKKWVPPANHPWREAARREIEKQARRVSTPSSLALPCASP
jgi:hypothetical protein